MSLECCLFQQAKKKVSTNIAEGEGEDVIQHLGKQLLYCSLVWTSYIEILSGVKNGCSSINAQDSQSDHSLFMYIVLHFKYTLEISLKRREATTDIWLFIPCLLWFDGDGCPMILNIVLVGFTVKLQAVKTGLRKVLNLIYEGEQG